MCRLAFARSASGVTRKTIETAEKENNEPIEFLGSKAHTFRASDERRSKPTDWPEYQGYVISVSMAVFLIYFCILREENDIDEKMSMNVSTGLVPVEVEIVQLRQAYQYSKEKKIPNGHIVRRMKELGVEIPTK